MARQTKASGTAADLSRFIADWQLFPVSNMELWSHFGSKCHPSEVYRECMSQGWKRDETSMSAITLWVGK